MKLYLDVCCLNRPFDDQSQDRIRLEAEAIVTILKRCQNKEWLLIGSEAIEYEISRIPDDERKQKVLALSDIVQFKISFDDAVVQRALFLQEAGFTALDALHLSCAEKGGVDIFLTTDDKLIRRSIRKKNHINIKVKVANPINWVTEVF